MAQKKETPSEFMGQLSEVILKHGHTTVGTRVLSLVGKEKREIVDGLEAIISELKTGDLKADTATKQTIKYVYRQITQ